jgi:hypothetical protein
MATVTANNNISAVFTQVLNFGIGQSTNLQEPMTLRSTFNVSGTLADQCTKLYSARLSLVASTPQTIDLQSLVDASGATISFNAIRFLAVRNNAATDGWILLVGAAGSNAFEAFVSSAGTFTVYPSSAANDGFTVFQVPNTTGGTVDSTHHNLKLDPGAHSFTADVLIGGY